MTILYEKETDIEIGLNYEEIAKEIINATLSYLDCPYECMINLLLTDNESIRQYNQEMRKINQATDVLSFPGVEFSKPGDFSIVEDNIYSYFDPESGELMLGDIVISLEKVIRQAKQFNHSEKREYAFLIAHSMLHLSGYDHIEDSMRIQMETMQEDILNSIGYTRDIL